GLCGERLRSTSRRVVVAGTSGARQARASRRAMSSAPRSKPRCEAISRPARVNSARSRRGTRFPPCSQGTSTRSSALRTEHAPFAEAVGELAVQRGQGLARRLLADAREDAARETPLGEQHLERGSMLAALLGRGVAIDQRAPDVVRRARRIAEAERAQIVR